MAKILIDMTNRNKRHVTGTSLCHYCRHDLFPHGKIIDHSTDKNAIRMKDGSWKCSVCLLEDMKKATALLNRQKGERNDR
jgi:hypothetical protein